MTIDHRMPYNMYVCMYVYIMYSVYKVDYREAAAPKKTMVLGLG